ncbi:alpha/beta hydrolase [Sphingomonas sp. CJ99]
MRAAGMMLGIAMLAMPGLAAARSSATAQSVARAPAIVETITVHGKSLEGNLEGNSADREVVVVLPPDYATNPQKRYPVVYHLHGFTSNARDNLRGIAADTALADGGGGVILVLPDAFTRHAGAMYSNSPTTGDFERFIAEDLVAHIDAKYRTLARRESRGLAGHSMGGYGTLRIGMKYPQVFSSLYAMSPCCLVPQVPVPDALARMKGMTMEQALAGGFFEKAGFATLSAWAPLPGNAPFHVDFGLNPDGTVDPVFAARISANAPLVMLPQYLGALGQYEAIAIDIGDKDFLLGSVQQFRAGLQQFGVKHEWELYEGDHVNRIAQQFGKKVLPFFQAHLDRQ